MVKIILDVRKSLSENAADYYELAKKSSRKLVGARHALASTQAKILALQQKKELAAEKEKPKLVRKEKKKKQWFEKFHWFQSTEGYLVVGGRDATSNEIVVKKHVEANDIVFHADVQGAPFFVIKNPSQKEIPPSTLQQTAIAAASYSKAWGSGFGNANVYWITPDQVSKTPESGEYLPKGAFVIRGKKNWMRNQPLEIAVGILRSREDKEEKEEKGNEGKGDKEVVGNNLMVRGGPKQAIEAQTNLFVIIEPGDTTSGKLAKEIKQELMNKADEETIQAIKEIPSDDIQNFIPGGKGKIKKKT